MHRDSICMYMTHAVFMSVVVCFCFSRRFIFLQINKKYFQEKKTDINNTVRKIVEKQKQKVCSDCVGVCGNVCCVAAVGKNSVFLTLEC